MKGFVKDPDATLDYTFDWSLWLGTDTITASLWIIESGVSAVAASESFTDTTTTVFLTDGALGENYLVTNRITTNGSRTDDRSVELRIRQR